MRVHIAVTADDGVSYEGDVRTGRFVVLGHIGTRPEGRSRRPPYRLARVSWISSCQCAPS